MTPLRWHFLLGLIKNSGQSDGSSRVEMLKSRDDVQPIGGRHIGHSIHLGFRGYKLVLKGLPATEQPNQRGAKVQIHLREWKSSQIWDIGLKLPSLLHRRQNSPLFCLERTVHQTSDDGHDGHGDGHDEEDDDDDEDDDLPAWDYQTWGPCIERAMRQPPRVRYRNL